MPTISRTGGAGSRPHSTIQFPYNDLKDAEEIAHIIFDKYPQGGTINQLAAVLGQSSTSGAFRNKIIGAKMFGLVDGTGRFSLTELGHRIIDQNHIFEARVEAFLAVPLFNALYEGAQKSGGKLPSTSAGIESWIVNLGVVPKQAPRARQTFQRSAALAGFFDHDPARLIMPSIITRYESAPSNIEFVKTPAPAVQQFSEPEIMRQPLIIGMLQTLPTIGQELSEDDLSDWAETFKRTLRLMYPKGRAAPTTVRKDGMPSGQRSSGEQVEDILKS
ncbi:MAG: hypothetical protein ACYCOU_19515 [Sulfobacillus sp.]